MIVSCAASVNLAVNLFFLLDLLLGPLNYLFDVLILDLHQPFLILFLKVSIDLFDFHHLLENEVAVLGRLETSRLIRFFT